MTSVLKIISYVGLAITVLTGFLYYGGAIESKSVYLNLLILGMVLWFGTAMFWIKGDEGME